MVNIYLIKYNYIYSSNQKLHYIDVIMTTVASQITSLTSVYSIVYSDADQRKYQSSASLTFVRGIHRYQWIPCIKGQWRGKCFHSMTSSWHLCISGFHCFHSRTLSIATSCLSTARLNSHSTCIWFNDIYSSKPRVYLCISGFYSSVMSLAFRCMSAVRLNNHSPCIWRR